MPDKNNPISYDMYVWGDVGCWPVSARMVKYIASECKEGMSILVNSLGGLTTEAIAISSILKLHGNAHVHFIGASASAATILSMGARRVSIDEDALYMVHKCSYLCDTFDYFNSDQLQEHIEELQKNKQEMEALDSVVAGMYARRCKKSQKELLDLMSKESWLTAKEALEWGFVDEITTYEEDKEAELSSRAVSLLREHGIKTRRSRKAGAIESIMRGLQSLFGMEDQPEKRQYGDPAMPRKDAQEYESPLMASLAEGLNMDAEGVCRMPGESVLKLDRELVRLDKEVSRLTADLSEREKEVEGLKETVSKKEHELSEKEHQISEKEHQISEKEQELSEMTSRLNDMAMKPANEPVAVVESGADKKNGKPYESVEKNVDYLLSLAKKYC